MRSILSILTCVGAMTIAATPAWATGAPIPVPEPTTMTLIAVGAAAAAAAYRLRGRR
ncbi:MAG: PEP-CTERM sorting domain-containing protein [Alphaproteobacteria bacterium]|nr:PEP-CTERM sorting domain-containing protein [Alphaproteobacteria bacterium]